MSGVSVAMIATAGLANAQETQSDSNAVDRVLGTVTVTATKKTDVEDVQSVPVSVTAFNDETLDALKVRDLQSLSFSTPNVSLDDIGTSRGTANFQIRGLGVNSSIPSIDPTVGVFIDGVYLGVNNGVVFDLFDLDSVEILRGPQGLLFGRNTTGGAIVVNTGNPTDTFEYKLRAAVEGPWADDDRGGNNSYVQGVVSGPLVEGKLNGKIGAYFNNDDGYFKNLFNDSNHGEAETTIIRGALEWFASEDLTFLAKLERSETDADGPSAQNRGFYDRDSFDLAIDNEGFIENEVWFGSLRTDLDVDFGNGTITNIFGYRSYEAETDGDIDSTPLFLFHSQTEFEQEQISNELRYNGQFGAANVTTGVYYFQQDLLYTENRAIPSDPRGLYYGGGNQDHTVWGVFGQVDYDVTDNFTLIAGLRYSSEEKDVEITYVQPRAECSVLSGTCPTDGINPITGDNNGFTDSQDWSNWTPKLGFQYFVNDVTQAYGNYTKGFRSGGYNFRITTPGPFEAIFPPGGSRAFDEEEVDSFEIGVKTETEDGRGQLNAAVFFTDIKDMQREVNLSDPTAGVVQTIVNTADAEITGLELEGRYAITDNFLLTGNVGLIDAEYQDVKFDISGDGVIDGEDLALALPRVPEVTFGIGALYDLNLGNRGSLVTRVNYQNRDEVAYTDNNFGWINEAEMVDADLTWNTPVEGLSVSLYGRNLLDEVQAGGDTQVPFGGPALAAAAPGGVNRSNGVGAPFDPNPAGGTFSPLKKGRVIGLELTLQR
ncbi:TonB-dependent receptor [Hyphomonas sp. FCG-A18]|uniref:TonB-dependent receptor n=1 Tax=Hyphomonas sp. FCG-A18 TaxID=3080019 RepID=UPI002B2A554F|nr:TonB-dependent receptor [Hyphomonas sp. FCG-A18]